jgi:hypothetical protein
MCKKILFLSVSRKFVGLGKTDISAQRMELNGFSIKIADEFFKEEAKSLFFTLGLNGSQGTLFIGLQLPAVFNEDGHPIIELKKHNVASFDTELDTRRMSLPNFIYFLEEVNKIEIVGDNMIFKDAPSANHKDRFDYCLENAVTDC